MKLTRVHLNFWERRQSKPKWTVGLVPTEKPATIDDCINAHAGIKHKYTAADRLQYFIHVYRKRGEPTIDALTMIATSDWERANKPESVAMAKRWINRLQQVKILKIELV